MSDETLLEEIRENFDDDVLEWADIREAGNEDMRIIADGPWTDKERKERKADDRPCLAFDELGQYTNQAIGDMRQNKRAVKVTPKGNGATDTTSQKRAGMIREIEYKSNAQMAYATAFESLIKRGYGYFKLAAELCSEEGFEQELVVLPIVNPDTVLLDPYAKKPDWSDMGHGYLIDSFSEKAFVKRWPDAQIQSFEGENAEIASAWIKNNRIQVAEYWRTEKKGRRKLLLDTGDADNPTEMFLDELPDGAKMHDSAVHVTIKGQKHKIPILNTRKTEKTIVVQYITNGLEILEKKITKWLEIPIIAVFGPEEYVSEGPGGGSKRRLLSMVRKARDSYKAYCYTRTNEVEIIGMVPKVLLLGYEGQFATNTPWKNVNKVAIPYGEVKAITTATGKEVLPLPERQLYDPPIQSLEMASSAFKMCIQSAMGVGNGMVSGKGNQSLDAKSGKAIDALDRQESQGTFVYIANFERGLERGGRLLDAALDWCYDTPREVGSRSPDDSYSSEKINQPVQGADGQPTQFNTADGDHGVTISVGPSDQSTRDAAEDVVEQIVGMPNPPPKAIALAIKLKNLGPIGDELAKVFDPDTPDPKIAQQQVAGLQAELQKAHAYGQMLFEQIQTKQPELNVKLEIARMQEETKRVLGLATINAEQAQQKLDKELGIVDDAVGRVHEANMENLKHGNKKELAAQATAADRTAQGSDQAHDTASQAADQAHEAAQATQAQGAAADSQESAQDATADQATQAQDAAADQAALKPAA
jgi:hypothetical protein